MGKLVYSCITPHGGEIIPELSGGNLERMAKTREAMEIIRESMTRAKPDTIIVLTPHGARLKGQITIANSETMEGSFGENDRSYIMKRSVDRNLATSIYDHAISASLPVGMLNYGSASGSYSTLPLDWGALVPLAFMPDVPIVVITPTRDLDGDSLKNFGDVLRQTIEAGEGRVALVASCDWSHTHDSQGPYGYHPLAKDVDQRVVDMIRAGEFEKVVSFTDQEIEQAKPDGIWQTLVLAGAVPMEERDVVFLSYEAPTYFGLLCATVTK